MDDREREEAHRLLAEALRSAGYSWIINQVEAEVETGKEVEGKDKEVSFLSREPYSTAERFGLLISATEQGVVELGEMAETISKTLRRQNASERDEEDAAKPASEGQVEEIVFEDSRDQKTPERGSERDERLQIPLDPDADALGALSDLRELLAELRAFNE